MQTIIITSDDTITIDGEAYKIVKSETFTPGYPDFPPTVREERDEETGGLLVEFGVNRLALIDDEVTQVKNSTCDRYVVVPIED
ncbi:hypothetical protein LCGC14_2379950 [marine sediment metagenome]|uniref:Uncharacterized protein n=1 Tax=marine sediment metagenome TaxID=412755 RepID=A0A0F9C173_9ZZZZ